MNNFVFDDAISCLDSDLIEEHIEKKESIRRKKESARASGWKKLAALAACICLFTMTCLVCVQLFFSDNSHSVEFLERPYKDLHMVISEQNVVWPWKYKMAYEKWESININGVKFIGTKNEIDASLVREPLGSFEATGYDDTLDYDNSGYRAQINVFKINNVSSERVVAADLDGKYYVFASSQYSVPKTLGDAIAEYGLEFTMPLARYSEKFIGEKEQRYSISDDSYVWEVLNGCKDAEAVDSFLEVPGWHETERNCIVFSVDSEALGVKNRPLSITEDGYLYSNALNGETLYYIGTDPAKEIITYVSENSVALEDEQQEKKIYGSICEITDEFIVIDDSALCVDPKDGIKIKIMIDDVKIARYFDFKVLSVGDTVQIEYSGKIDISDIYTVDSAISISKAHITDKNVIIPE